MKTKSIIYKVMLLLCFSMIAGCSGPWKGKIIDIETKEPLEGVVVLAVWERVYRTPSGPSSSFYEAKEVVTNKAGEFEIPSYTPINLLPLISNMRGPVFTIFKPGYGSLAMALGKYLADEDKKTFEPYSGKISGYMIRVSTGLIELQKLKTREERRIGQPSPVGDKKDWRKQRELIRALRQEWQNLYNEDPKDLYSVEE